MIRGRIGAIAMKIDKSKLPFMDLCNQENSDWLKQWRLPPYKSPEFMRHLAEEGMTLEDFGKTHMYDRGIIRGLIVDDVWVGENGAGPDEGNSK